MVFKYTLVTNIKNFINQNLSKYIVERKTVVNMLGNHPVYQ